MMFGVLVNLSGLFSSLAAPFSAAASAGGALAAARQQRAMAERAMLAAMPKVTDGEPHIPRVKRKGV